MSGDLAKLFAPFPPERVSWRLGSTNRDKTKGMALAYIDARDVMERLDEVVGAANWQDRYEFHGSRTICYLSLRVDGEWITKADGAGDSDVEAEKGAISDALKRAAVKWGIGRYLYELDAPWVEVEPYGRSFKIKESPANQQKLNRALGLKSAYAMKQEEDWTSLMAELENDLADARTIPAMAKLYRDWDDRRKKENWPVSYWNTIKERFTARKHEMQGEAA